MANFELITEHCEWCAGKLCDVTLRYHRSGSYTDIDLRTQTYDDLKILVKAIRLANKQIRSEARHGK